MNALDVISSRQSARALSLTAPAPAGEDLADILQAAMSAPDHGAMRPWRFKLIEGDARAKLGDVMADALKKKEPETDEAALSNIRAKPLRAPLIVAVCAEVADHPKVPDIEQVIAAACAGQNILNAAHAKGYGAVMLTGWVAHDTHVKNALGLAERDVVVAFIYMGTSDGSGPVKPRPHHTDFTETWTG